MIIYDAHSPEEVHQRKDGYLYETDNFIIVWKGAIYIKGYRVGYDSVAELGELLEKGNILQEDLCQLLHGTFGLFVYDRAKKVWYAMVDNAGLYQAYYDKNMIGTSLLEIMGRRNKNAISPAGVADFPGHGALHWGNTLIDGVKRIPNDVVVCLSDHTTLMFKELPHNVLPMAAVESHFGGLMNAFADEKISLDLTGGFDTRYVLSMFKHYGANFETAVIGPTDHPDVILAKRMADTAGCPLHVTEPDASNIVNEIDNLFREVDGSGDVLEFHRSRQLSAERSRRGVSVVVTGDGGAVLKEFWWLQDFPRYWSEQTNFRRLYDIRIKPNGIPADHLYGSVGAKYTDLRNATLFKLENLLSSTNTQSYDKAYYHWVTAFGGMFATSNINNNLKVISPFLDWDNFQVGYHLPRRKRIACWFHRDGITRHAPDLAKIPTTEGLNASTDLKYLPSNLFRYGQNKAKRLIKKTAEQYGQKLFRSKPIDSPGMIQAVRRSGSFATAVRALKDNHILNPDLSIDHIRGADVGKLLTVGLLIHHL